MQCSFICTAVILSSNLLVKLFNIYFTKSKIQYKRINFGMRDSAKVFVRIGVFWSDQILSVICHQIIFGV